MTGVAIKHVREALGLNPHAFAAVLGVSIATSLGWQECERAMKCARTVCQVDGARWWNSSTKSYYCMRCALRINEHAPGLCVMLSDPDNRQWRERMEADK